jgi:hypothetical protein
VATINNRVVVFAKLGESPPFIPACAGDFLGADRDGRYYFNRYAVGWKSYAKGIHVTVVSPKHEQPGQICRVTRERTPIVHITKDDTGKIWGEPTAGGAVLQWNNGQWVDTPVQPLLRPHWIARPAPPWTNFQWNSNAIFRAHGKNGSLLVVRVRDFYQIEAMPEPKDKPSVVPRYPAPGAPLYHLEAHFYRNGKWSEPTPLREFVAKHAATLISEFPTSQGEMNFLAYANDGKRLWFAADGKVFTADKHGTITESAWPLPQMRAPLSPLSPVMLAQQPDGKVLFCANRNFAHTLAFANGKVTTEAATMPGGATRWWRTRDQSLWMWHADADNLKPQVWLFGEKEWREHKELGVPLTETATGELWFLPVLPDPKTLKLSVARGAKIQEVAIAEAELPLGFDEVPQGAILWVWGDRLFRLEPGEKPRVTWRILSEKRFGGGLVTTDAKGYMLFGHAHGLLKP